MDAERESNNCKVEGSVICLLCKGTIFLHEGSMEVYKQHLTLAHGITWNREWLVGQTLGGEIPEEAVDKEDKEEPLVKLSEKKGPLLSRQLQASKPLLGVLPEAPGTDHTMDVFSDIKAQDNGVFTDRTNNNTNACIFKGVDFTTVRKPVPESETCTFKDSDVTSLEECSKVMEITVVENELKADLACGEKILNGNENFVKSQCNENPSNGENLSIISPLVRTSPSTEPKSEVLEKINPLPDKEESSCKVVDVAVQVRTANCNKRPVKSETKKLNKKIRLSKKNHQSDSVISEGKDKFEEICEVDSKYSMKRCSVLLDKHKIQMEMEVDQRPRIPWYDGNTFTCGRCSHSSTSLEQFKQHVRLLHGSSLAKSVGHYSQTELQYQCRICRMLVHHEKRAVRDHLKTHCLTLATYHRLYGNIKVDKYSKKCNKSIAKTSGRGKDVSRKKKLEGSVGQQLIIKGQLPRVQDNSVSQISGVQDKSVSQIPGVQEDSASQIPAVKKDCVSQISIVKEDSVSQISVVDDDNASQIPGVSQTSVPQNDSVSQIPAVKEDSVPSLLCGLVLNGLGEVNRFRSVQDEDKVESEELYVYLCPFQDCNFVTDIQEMKNGAASLHCQTMHGEDPIRDQDGCIFKKITMEKQMQIIHGIEERS